MKWLGTVALSVSWTTWKQMLWSSTMKTLQEKMDALLSMSNSRILNFLFLFPLNTFTELIIHINMLFYTSDYIYMSSVFSQSPLRKYDLNPYGALLILYLYLNQWSVDWSLSTRKKKKKKKRLIIVSTPELDYFCCLGWHCEKDYNYISHVLLIYLSLICWFYRYLVHFVSKISIHR